LILFKGCIENIELELPKSEMTLLFVELLNDGITHLEFLLNVKKILWDSLRGLKDFNGNLFKNET